MDISAENPPSTTGSLLDAGGRGIERDRAHKFLISHWFILGVTALTMAGNLASGAVDADAAVQFFSLVVIVGGITAFGTHRHRQGGNTSHLITAILYIDSAVALVYFYLAGEFETPAMGLLTIPIIMAPVYTARRAVWGIAGLQIALYLFLMAGRIGGWLDFLPYGYMVEVNPESEVQFVVLSIGAFVTVTVAVAMLSGEASIDILTSRAQLQNEVELQTHALAEAKDAVERTNAELAGANDQLRATNLALAQFNAAISHDLRSPLQTMTLHMEMMLGDDEHGTPGIELSDAVRERLERTLTAAQRLGRMIGDLQELARTTTDLGQLRPVDLDDLSDQVIEDLSARIRGADAVVERTDALPMALGNIGLLRRVLQNLIENAVKYGAPPKPRVRLGSCEAEPGWVAFFVEDDGPGIESQDHERIFELFQRLERDASREGTGAGLAIVHRIVHAHGGTISVETGQVLPGARFVVRLEAVS